MKYALTLYNYDIPFDRLQRRLFNYGYKWKVSGRKIMPAPELSRHIVVYPESKVIYWGYFDTAYPKDEEMAPSNFLKLLEEGKI